MPSTPLSVADVVGALEREYRLEWAAEWDAVGLVVGDPGADVSRVLLAVDPVPVVVEQARAVSAQLIITHHPLLLGGVTAVARSDPKGAIVHDLIANGTALFVAHTNADVAPGGVNDALAAALGLQHTRPLLAQAGEVTDQLTVFVPVASAADLVDALADAGAGRTGDYDRAAFTSDGVGSFRPLAGAHPAIGQVGRQERVAETRIEMTVPRADREAVVAALRATHPYEEPAFAIVEHALIAGRHGLGRIGALPVPVTLTEFAALVGQALPATTAGLRAAGDPDRLITTVAVCGGSGGSEIAAARAAGADAYVTSDLKHHAASEATTERGPDAMALIDATHWATEWPWLPVLARRLDVLFGDLLEVVVSEHVTDPWTLHISTSRKSGCS